MFDIAFHDFRGFRSQGFVRVRPITILVGENSAGKSSFLAGLNFANNLLSDYSVPSFNSDPFQLGTFQQIAHFRGGRGGRAREFGINIRGEVVDDRHRVDSETNNIPYELATTFTNSDSQATLSTMRLTSDGESIFFGNFSDGLRIEHVGRRNVRTSLGNSILLPSSRMELARLWTYVFQDIFYRFQSGKDPSDATELNDKVLKSVLRLAAVGELVGRSYRYETQATSAIRTKPNRTYTPGAETHDGEGTHVPFEIAKLYRSRSKEKEDWRTFKDSIEKFGSSSGMFKEIAVKSFGQSSSDPFQIQFSSDGPKTNIVDLGYGTSQVLPILYDISMADPDSCFLIQQPEVHLHPKAQAALGQYFVNAFTESGKRFVIETHSDFIVDRIRNSISENALSPSDVSILFFRRTRLENKIVPIELDKFGDPILPPEDYRSFFIGEQMKMLGV
jgi:predicted ATPase